MASALYQDWENYNPNKPTALRPPSYWDAVKENLPHALRGFQRMPTNVMGFPVDMVNLAVGAEKPFLGSEYLAEKLNVPERTGHPTELGTEIASEFLLPTGQGLGRSALKAEEFLGRTFKEKLPEVVGKHVPEPFRTPITGLNIKPKDSALSPKLSKEEAIVTKQAPKIENLNFNELLTAWTVDQTKVPRKLLSDKLSTPENKNRTIKALNNLGYKDTVPVYRAVRYKGELKDEDLISASLTPEANINFTKFSTEGKTINPLSDNPVPQDFAILRYDVPINDVKGYLPEFAGDIKRTVNKKIKDLGIGQEKISGLKTVTNPSAHAKQLLSTQDEIIADVSKIKPKVLQHYGGNKNLNPLSSELSIPSEIAKGKITKPSDLPSNYSVLPFPKGGINAPKEAWDAWAKNEEIAKKEMIKYYKEFYNIK